MNVTAFADMPGMAAPLMPTDTVSRAMWELNDSGNAKRFVALHGDEFIYVRSHGWYAFTGTHWSSDGGEARALQAARRTAEAIKGEANALFEAGSRDEGRAKSLNTRAAKVRDWAEKSGSIARAKGMLEFAAADLGQDLSVFDQDPYALNVQNGTLRFFEADGRWQVRLDPHNAFDRISRIASVAFDPKAAAADWTAHLEKMVPDFWERRYVLRVIGYLSLGLTSEQSFFLWQGPAGAGKSLTANVMRRVLGSYAMEGDVGTFLEDKGRSSSAASPDLARLAGATRLLCTSEPPRGARLNEGLIKRMCSGAPLTARFLNREFFEFDVKVRLLMEANSLPSTASSDDGVFRRLQLMPWRVKLTKDQMDGGLEERIVKLEGAGVLNSIVEGAIAYLTGGLAPPKGIMAAHADYRNSSNSFRGWIEGFTIFDPDHVCLIDTLYKSYRDEIEGQGLEPISKKAFALALSDLQVINTAREGGTGKHRRKGLRLLTDFERSDRAAALAAAADGGDARLTPARNPSHDSDEDDRGSAEADQSDADRWQYDES